MRCLAPSSNNLLTISKPTQHTILPTRHPTITYLMKATENIITFLNKNGVDKAFVELLKQLMAALKYLSNVFCTMNTELFTALRLSNADERIEQVHPFIRPVWK